MKKLLIYSELVLIVLGYWTCRVPSKLSCTW